MSEFPGGINAGNGRLRGAPRIMTPERAQAIARPLPADRPVLIAGPTASGKSALALAIAEAGGGVIVNADALQVFACWRVLTARPGAADLARARHALFGHVAQDAPYSVGAWLRDLAPILDGPERPIIVGGTGLYLSALTGGLAPIPPVPAEVRTRADALLRDKGVEEMAAALDPATRARIDTANPARVQRAWEVLTATGRGLAAWQAETGPPMLAASGAETIVLWPDRDRLTARIEARFDAMMAAGALDEVRAARGRWNPAHPSAQAIGARELMAHLDGTHPLDAAVAAAKLASRRYAKRQRTWFRSRMGGWQKIDPG